MMNQCRQHIKYRDVIMKQLLSVCYNIKSFVVSHESYFCEKYARPFDKWTRPVY